MRVRLDARARLEQARDRRARSEPLCPVEHHRGDASTGESRSVAVAWVLQFAAGMAVFKDRRDAGRQLAYALAQYKDDRRAIVIALSPADVAVGYEIAKRISAPLDVLAEHVGSAVRGKTAIVVDDGLATVDAMRVAAIGLRRFGPARLVVAVPVAQTSTREALRDCVDELIYLISPHRTATAGLWYEDTAELCGGGARAARRGCTRRSDVHGSDTGRSASARPLTQRRP